MVQRVWTEKGLLSIPLGSHGYERRFSEALLRAVRPGDCVLDVGANVGFYTQKFAARVGPAGSVVAFEPFEAAFLQLSATTSGTGHVKCMKLALGAEESELLIDLVGPASVGNSLTRTSTSENAERIILRTGKNLLQEGVKYPAVLKIDVEGFEEDVLWGFGDALRDPRCRGVFVEAHYGVLEKRGFPRTPARLVSRLKDLGFRTRWLDPSHLSATRD